MLITLMHFTIQNLLVEVYLRNNVSHNGAYESPGYLVKMQITQV